MQVSTSNSGRSSGVAKPHAAGGDQRHAKRLGQADQRLVVVFLIALQVPLQLDVRLAAAEDADHAIEQAADAVALGLQQRPARQRDEAAVVKPSRSSSVSAPSPFGARSFMREIRRQRLRQPSWEATRTGREKLVIWRVVSW